jgi:hypothetical protein
MAFAQLTYRESLRDIETCLRSQGSGLYHLGIRGPVSCSTLAYANDNRDWRIYADLASEKTKLSLCSTEKHGKNIQTHCAVLTFLIPSKNGI